MRLVLAATLSPTYGIYSGYELCENTPIPGREEYLYSEKYEVKPRDWDAPGNLNGLIITLNRFRRDNPALHHLTNLTFLETDNPQLLAYLKVAPDRTNAVIIVVNLDWTQPQYGTLDVPLASLGLAAGSTYQVYDVLSDQRFTWGATNWVRLDPIDGEPAHVLRVELE
jgi:starch synthase (maltosyl-transferring)